MSKLRRMGAVALLAIAGCVAPETGAAGYDGERGPPGDPGASGEDGIDGADGESGTDGAPGQSGAPGLNGVLAGKSSLVVYTVSSFVGAGETSTVEAFCEDENDVLLHGYCFTSTSGVPVDSFSDNTTTNNAKASWACGMNVPQGVPLTLESRAVCVVVP